MAYINAPGAVVFAKNPTFGTARGPAAYQQPRTFRISMGLRF